MKQRSRAFLPYSIGEPAIRRALQNLYVAIIGSNDNARSLIENNPFNLDVNTVVGIHCILITINSQKNFITSLLEALR